MHWACPLFDLAHDLLRVLQGASIGSLLVFTCYPWLLGEQCE